MLFGFLLFLFIITCVFLCLLILIQSDKGGGLNSSLGGGLSGASNFLGTQDTANVLTKGTYIFGGVFLVLCILMTFFGPGGGSGGRSELQRHLEKTQSVTSQTSVTSFIPTDDDATATEPSAEGSAEMFNAVEVPVPMVAPE